MLWDQLRFTSPPHLSFPSFNLFGRRAESEDNILPHAHHTVFDSISEGVLVLDIDNQVISSNPAARKLIQSVSPHPSPTTDLLDNRHVDAVLFMWPTIRAFLNSTTREHSTSVESNNRDVLRNFDIHVTPIIGEEGLFSGRIVLIEETTERENAAKALRQRKQQLRLMVERLRQVDRKKMPCFDGLDIELHSSLTRIDLQLNNLRKGIDVGFSDAINRLEQEISCLYSRFETIVQQGNIDPASVPLNGSSKIASPLSGAPQEALFQLDS